MELPFSGYQAADLIEGLQRNSNIPWVDRRGGRLDKPCHSASLAASLAASLSEDKDKQLLDAGVTD